ncbi:LDH1 (YBR204C) [Zygosaccharomyces parabailii]|nr:LDH1 (YBR204C) [Zygosaccharomyces parabailii]CDH08858.1 related to Lipid droplet hydrolase 1 [Zygosaccharomyces bailii ISA1307]
MMELSKLIEAACELEGEPVSERTLASIVAGYQDGSTLSSSIIVPGARNDFTTQFIASHEDYMTLKEGKVRLCHNIEFTQGEEIYIFIHGLGGNLEQFEPLLRLVDSTKHSFLAMDLPGFGKSEEWKDYPMLQIVKSIREVLTKLKQSQKRLVLVGHSMGCYLAVHFYHLYQEHMVISQLVLLSPPKRAMTELQGSMVQWGLWVGYTWPWLFDFYRSWFDQSKGLSSSGIEAFFGSEDISTIGTYRKLWQFHNNVQIKSKSIFGYLIGWEPVSWDQVNISLAKCSTKLVVMCGDRDSVTPCKDSEEIFRFVPGTIDKRLAIIPHCGHNVCFDTPKETCRLFHEHVLSVE